MRQSISIRSMACCVMFVVCFSLMSCAAPGSGASSGAHSSSGHGGASPNPAASATPNTSAVVTIPPIHIIDLGGYKTSMALPGALGLALDPALPSNFAGMPSLSFYRYSTHKVELIATAPKEPDGSLGGILGSQYGGDWISYVTEDSTKNNWTLWAYNVATSQRIQVDSESKETTYGPWTAYWVTNATDLVWGVTTYDPATNQVSSRLLDYSYAAGQTTQLYASSTMEIGPEAMNDSAILIDETDVNGNGGTWLFTRSSQSATKLSSQIAVNAAMSSRYAVWDDPHTNTLTLYDIGAGRLTENWIHCLRPAIAESQPYAVCAVFGANVWLLAHVPDGSYSQFGKFMGGDGGEIFDGRVFWVGPDGNEQYFDLPSQ